VRIDRGGGRAGAKAPVQLFSGPAAINVSHPAQTDRLIHAPLRVNNFKILEEFCEIGHVFKPRGVCASTIQRRRGDHETASQEWGSGT